MENYVLSWISKEKSINLYLKFLLICFYPKGYDLFKKKIMTNRHVSELDYLFDSDDYRVSKMITNRHMNELDYLFDSDDYRVSKIIDNRHMSEKITHLILMTIG